MDKNSKAKKYWQNLDQTDIEQRYTPSGLLYILAGIYTPLRVYTQ
jgi:hypothetical protein